MLLKVMTFNIHHGKGTDGDLNLQRIADMIADSNVDIACLNEVDRHYSPRSDYVDQIGWLAEYLQMDYAYGPAVVLKSKNRKEKREYGNALLSRYPIADIKNHRFHFGLVEDRSLLETTVHLNDQPLKMYTTHLSLDPLTHKQQTSFILDKIKHDHHPIILSGDWNMKPGARAWRRITRHLADSWYTVGEGSGFTFPSFQPRMRLDYIFVTSAFHVTHAEVWNANPEASDHLPLITTLNTQFHENGFHVCH